MTPDGSTFPRTAGVSRPALPRTKGERPEYEEAALGDCLGAGLRRQLRCAGASDDIQLQERVQSAVRLCRWRLRDMLSQSAQGVLRLELAAHLPQRRRCDNSYRLVVESTGSRRCR